MFILLLTPSKIFFRGCSINDFYYVNDFEIRTCYLCSTELYSTAFHAFISNVSTWLYNDSEVCGIRDPLTFSHNVTWETRRRKSLESWNIDVARTICLLSGEHIDYPHQGPVLHIKTTSYDIRFHFHGLISCAFPVKFPLRWMTQNSTEC